MTRTPKWIRETAQKRLTANEREIVQDDFDFMNPPAKPAKEKNAAKMRIKKAAADKLNLIPVNIKMSEETRKRIQRKARLYAGGNESAWLRYAALHYKPKEGEKVNIYRY